MILLIIIKTVFNLLMITRSKSRNSKDSCDNEMKDFIVPDNYVEYENGEIDTNYEESDEFITQFDNTRRGLKRLKLSSFESENELKQMFEERENSDTESEYDENFSHLVKNFLSTYNKGNKYPTDEIDWKRGLKPAQLKQIQTKREKLEQRITTMMPQLKDILDLPMTLQERVDLYRQYKILENADNLNTVENVAILESLTQELEKHRIARLTRRQVSDYEKIEVELKNNMRSQKPLKCQILEANIPSEIKSIIYEKYQHMEKNNNDSERSKMEQWIDWALSIPYTSNQHNFPSIHSHTPQQINEFLVQVKQKLDDRLYGMETVKQQIIRLLNNKITNNNSTGVSMALVGPPGVGKTSICKALSEVLNFPFQQISLGGVKDSSFLEGHGFTYEGSMPGIIVQMLKKMKSNNGIIFFDEFDKLSESEHGKEVAWSLLHIIDYTQNSQFRDKYLSEITIDLSKIWFIYSLNSSENMDSALKDRLPLIQLEGYTFNDKINILQSYVLPDMLSQLGMKDGDIIIDHECSQYILHKISGNERGVRNLRNAVFEILSQLNLIRTTSNLSGLNIGYTIPDFQLPYQLQTQDVDQILSKWNGGMFSAPPAGMYN